MKNKYKNHFSTCWDYWDYAENSLKTQNDINKSYWKWKNKLKNHLSKNWDYWEWAENKFKTWNGCNKSFMCITFIKAISYFLTSQALLARSKELLRNNDYYEYDMFNTNLTIARYNSHRLAHTRSDSYRLAQTQISIDLRRLRF